MRSSLLKQLFESARPTTDDARRTLTDHNSSCSVELKRGLMLWIVRDFISSAINCNVGMTDLSRQKTIEY